MGRVRKLLKNWHRPKWWVDTAFPYVHSQVRSVARKPMYHYFEVQSSTGVEIMAEDWDNLLLLDACRWDMFSELNTIDGDLDHRISKGSSTNEFLEKNFNDTTHHDTVYVTANPMHVIDDWCSVNCYEVFHKVVDVWDQHWDNDLNTVHPQQMVDAMMTAAETYPKKRIFGHFIQPHHPFIGEKGRHLEDAGLMGILKARNDPQNPRNGEMKIWERLRRGKVSKDDVWEAYLENLTITLPYIETLVEELRGKTVITSDHGNMVGEFCWPFPFRVYGHPVGLHTSKLVKVPWLELINGARPVIENDRPTSESYPNDVDVVEERLDALGYR